MTDADAMDEAVRRLAREIEKQMSEMGELVALKSRIERLFNGEMNPAVEKRWSVIADRYVSLITDVRHSLDSGRERSIALTKLEESMMWAYAGFIEDSNRHESAGQSAR